MPVTSRGRRSAFSDPRIVLMLIAVVIWLIGTVAVILTTNPPSPAMWPIGVVVGKTPWAVSTTVVMVVLLVLVIVVGVWLWRVLRRHSANDGDLAPYRVAARSMVDPNKLRHISEKDATAVLPA